MERERKGMADFWQRKYGGKGERTGVKTDRH